MNDTLVAFVFVQTRLLGSKTATQLARIPEVEELHRIAGDDCYVVRVRVANTEHLGRLVRDKIERIKSVNSTRTTLVLKTLKDQPVPNPQRSSSSGAVAPDHRRADRQPRVTERPRSRLERTRVTSATSSTRTTAASAR